MQDGSLARLNNDGYFEVTFNEGLSEIHIEFTRPDFDTTVEVEVFVDDVSIGSLVYDGPDGDMTTLSITDLTETGTITVTIDAAQGRPLINNVTWTTNPE